MRQQCIRYHKAHPKVWTLFCQFTFELIERGFKNYGAKAVMERIRWETDQANVKGMSEFKIGNNYTAFYARRFMKKNSEHDGFFRLRKQTSKNKQPINRPELGPKDFD